MFKRAPESPPRSIARRIGGPRLIAFGLLALSVTPASAQDNDRCEDAMLLETGELIEGSLDGATADGVSTCADGDRVET
ncbi:MAG: hypothetical protein AAFY88_27880, partial [Acidobacteriota bacterium]